MTSDITQQQRLSNKHKRKKSFVYQNKGENFKRRPTFPQYNQRKTGNGPRNTKQETVIYSPL